jgi:leader peptidase (prepilin peptidase)/N-methyltransferase
VTVLAIVAFVVGGPIAYGLNRWADEVAQRREDARRRTRLRGRAAAVYVATPLLLAGCAFAFGVHARFFVAAFYCVVLVVLAAIDVEQRIIPNVIVVPAAALVLVAQSVIDPSFEWAIAAFAAAGFFLVAALAYPGGMGMGDVKLALLLGAMLGRGVAAAVMLALLASIVPSIAILVRHGAKGRKMGIPFAPFLALGGAVALFAGRRLVNAWLGL